MAGFDPMAARSAAAGQMMGGGMPPGDAMPAPEEPLASSLENPAGDDVESAIADLEAAVQQLDPQQADEIRQHLNAIREIASSGEEKAVGNEPTAEELAGSEPMAPPPAGAGDALKAGL
jgi:hypothetical protein